MPTRLSRTVGLSRTKGLPQRRTAGRKTVNPAGPLCCLACGTTFQLTRSHILTRKQHPRHAANPANLVWLCWPHHQQWEHRKAEFARCWPAAWATKLDMMQQLDAKAYAFFRLKNPY